MILWRSHASSWAKTAELWAATLTFPEELWVSHWAGFLLEIKIAPIGGISEKKRIGHLKVRETCEPWIEIRLLKLLLSTAFHHPSHPGGHCCLWGRSPWVQPHCRHGPLPPGRAGDTQGGRTPQRCTWRWQQPCEERDGGLCPAGAPTIWFQSAATCPECGSVSSHMQGPGGGKGRDGRPALVRRGHRSRPSSGISQLLGFVSNWTCKIPLRAWVGVFLALAVKGFGCIFRSVGSKKLTVQHRAVTGETGSFFQVYFYTETRLKGQSEAFWNSLSSGASSGPWTSSTACTKLSTVFSSVGNQHSLGIFQQNTPSL